MRVLLHFFADMVRGGHYDGGGGRREEGRGKREEGRGRIKKDVERFSYLLRYIEIAEKLHG